MREITIGRLADNSIALKEDSKVSRRHCRCYEDHDKYYVEDLHSANGVFVDGNRITEITEFSTSTMIQIGNTTFKGEELISKMAVDTKNAVDQCKEYEKKYDALVQRYHNNMQMLLDTIQIKRPYSPTFNSDDDRISYLVEEYTTIYKESLRMLQLMAKSSSTDAISYRVDLDQLTSLCQQVPNDQKSACAEIRQRIVAQMSHLQHDTQEEISNAYKRLEAYYLDTFIKYFELNPTLDDKSLIEPKICATPYVLYGIQEISVLFFDQDIHVSIWQFAPFLKKGNLVIQYAMQEASSAQDIVNSIVGRILAGSNSGNIQVHMVDINELGGTSNTLKLLDRQVFSMIAHSSELQSMLSLFDEHVEDVVQNLLQGPYTSLSSYNSGKEKQEPYHIVVLKDFPFGVSPESAHLIQRIIVNGSKAGVHFIFMCNSKYADNNEDSIKIGRIMHLDDPSNLNATIINLSASEHNYQSKFTYINIDDKLMYNIVQKVNAGFEMKEDEVLRLTDYIIPQEEWWTKHSANRVDIPFGMSQNKQIQKINITQESGQNSAIVIGIPGSGKSVFLHVLIASAMVNYSPRELQMYLLDFSGVEFDVYARHKLPHARVIAPEAEREFGLSILKEVFEEGNRRMALCREHKVTNIVELKQKNPELNVPRLLVIIDEFQKIFEIENDAISKEANQKIHAIIQEYRKFGINLILATQKLPAKSVVPYDLIANRVVFKSDPNDFNNLIKWKSSVPQPRLQTGNCVYNNESGLDMANCLTRSFFIDASNDLEHLLDKVAQFAQTHADMVERHELLTFRSNELPEFCDRLLSERHIENQDAPNEVGVYMGESIAIAPCHVYVPLTKDSRNNILIIGGQPNVAKAIAYHTLISEVAGHNDKSCDVVLMNFMRQDDPVQDILNSGTFAAIADYCNLQEVSSLEDVEIALKYIKEEIIEPRKKDSSLPLKHLFINIFDFQRGQMFDGTGRRGDFQSESGNLLEYILKNGPLVGVFTVLQVDTMESLGKLGYGVENAFNHRIALQMSEKESDKLIGTSAANRLLELNKPSSVYRGLYYNVMDNTITKFKPYKL